MKKKWLLLFLISFTCSTYSAFFYSWVSIFFDEPVTERKNERDFYKAIRDDDIQKVLEIGHGPSSYNNLTMFQSQISTGAYYHVRSLKMAQLLHQQGIPIKKDILICFLKYNTEQVIYDIASFFLSIDREVLEAQDTLPLLRACDMKYPEALRALLRLKSNVKAKDFWGNGPLHLVIKENDLINSGRRKEALECARILLALNEQRKEDIKK